MSLQTLKRRTADILLQNLDVKKSGISIDELEKEPIDGTIAYRCNPQRQFNDFTDKAHQIFEKFALYASPERAKELGERVKVSFADGTI